MCASQGSIYRVAKKESLSRKAVKLGVHMCVRPQSFVRGHQKGILMFERPHRKNPEVDDMRICEKI